MFLFFFNTEKDNKMEEETQAENKDKATEEKPSEKEPNSYI